MEQLAELRGLPVVDGETGRPTTRTRYETLRSQCDVGERLVRCRCSTQGVAVRRFRLAKRAHHLRRREVDDQQADVDDIKHVQEPPHGGATAVFNTAASCQLTELPKHGRLLANAPVD